MEHTNQDAAHVRAAQSDGVHYSVYGRGHIVSLAHSTIMCAIDDNPSEKFCLWMNLASFAIDEQELVSAHELMSGGAIQPMEDDVEAEAAEKSDMPSLPCDERAASVRRMQRRSQRDLPRNSVCNLQMTAATRLCVGGDLVPIEPQVATRKNEGTRGCYRNLNVITERNSGFYTLSRGAGLR